MMNQGTSFLKRFFALVMALALLVSGSNLGAALQVFAAEAETVTAGEIVADNYDLTEAEKNLLNSGLLAGEVITYTAPDNSDLITVDTENAKITAANEGEWVAVSADIVVNGAVVETVALVNGEGAYNPAVGNAFSVRVNYVLTQEVDEAAQTDMLSAAAWLKNGIANLDAVAAQSGNLYILESALPTLVDIATNGLQFGQIHIELEDQNVKNAILALDEQLQANGKLAVSVIITEYEAASKTGYLLNNGAAALEAVTALSENVTILRNWLDGIAAMIGSLSAQQKEQLRILHGVIGNIDEALQGIVASDWTAAQKGTAMVVSGVDYAALDALVAAIETVSAVEVKNPLTIAEVSIQKNLSMFNVTVKVVMNNVVDVVDSADLETTESTPVVITVAAGATAEEVAAEAAEAINAALAGWDAYADGKFDVTATELPEALDADIEYVVTYAPKTFTVTYGYATDAPTAVPYGYQMTLPAHSNVEQAYDYTVNGEAYSQGEVVVIEGNTEISRASGKAYTVTDLYTVIGENYGNAVVYGILSAGALKNNDVISVRKPDPADAASLLYLYDGALTADAYTAAYAGLNWAPYSYGATGVENLFSGNNATWEGNEVKVQYKLALTNYTAAQVADILALAVELKNDYNAQKSTMDSFANNYNTMGMLDKTKLGALNGVISVTDLHSDPAKNEELKAYFTGLVGGIINNNLEGNNLRIYNMLGNYMNDGMRYYYNNAAAIIAEIESLAGYLGGMLADDEKIAALTVLVGAAGFPEYVDKIAELEGILANVLASLTVPNEAINLESKNLGKLLEALSVEGEATAAEAGVPYLMSDVLTALDQSQVMIQIIVNTPVGNTTITTPAMDRDTVLTPEVVLELKASLQEKLMAILGMHLHFYEPTIEGPSLDELVGQAITESINIYYNFAPFVYVVEIEGEADQYVTILDREIDLPKHPTPGFTYEYNVDGVSGITTSTYTFTVEQLERLFVGGVYTITRAEINEAYEKLDETFTDWLVKDEAGNITGLYATVDGNAGGVMGFVMEIINSGYSYIGLNGEPLLYLAEDNSLEICMQTLVNALLNDNSFGSQTLINLGKAGKGEFVHTTMQLGDSADEIHFNDLDFVLYMNTLPAQMATVGNALDKAAPYMTFNSNDGVFEVNFNLPEKVYEVYLGGMLATGNVTKDNMNAINDEIAFQFFYDYIELIINSDATTTSFTNTLSMLGQSYDLTGYEGYYQMVKKALTNPGVQINEVEDEDFEMSITGKSQNAINSLINLLGIDVSAYSTYLGMIKEYKYEDAELTGSARANLVNTDHDFEAALIDLNAAGVTNKFDFTNDLPARCDEIANLAAVILLDTVDGDLVFNGTTILDLNGKTVNGSIISNGTLIIVDSFMGTANGGYVTGDVSGNVHVFAGSYAADVTRYLKDGYKQVDGAVQNVLYTIESDGNDVTFVINTDFMADDALNGYLPDMRVLAVNVAVDLILNYYASCALTIDDNTIYNLHVADLIGLYASSTKVDDLIQVVLDCFNLPELSNFVNIVLEDLLDFGAMADALKNETVLATYTLHTTPIAANLSYVADGDYVTGGIGANTMNDRVGKTFDVSLKLVGSNKDRVVPMLAEMGEVIDASAEINLAQPIYVGATNSLYLEGSAASTVNLNMNYEDVYAQVLCIILANGNEDVKDDLIAAVNANDRVAMKALIDAMSVKDVFDALKALNRNENFIDLAAKLGANVEIADATALERAAHLILTAVGKALDVLDINGYTNKTMGMLDTDGDGIYSIGADGYRAPDVSRFGFSVYAEASVDFEFNFNLFGERCLWGDANHDGLVNALDASLVLQYFVGNAPANFCTRRTDVNGDGSIDHLDASLILQHFVGLISKFPAEN